MQEIVDFCQLYFISDTRNLIILKNVNIFFKYGIQKTATENPRAMMVYRGQFRNQTLLTSSLLIICLDEVYIMIRNSVDIYYVNVKWDSVAYFTGI